MRTLRALQIVHPEWTRRQCIVSLRERQRRQTRGEWGVERQYIRLTALMLQPQLDTRGEVEAQLRGMWETVTFENLSWSFKLLGASTEQAATAFNILEEAIRNGPPEEKGGEEENNGYH